MKLDLAVVTSLLLTSVSANAVPQQGRRHVVRVDGEPQQAPPVEDSTFDLWKRRGGGGGGGRGGGGGGGGSRGGSSGGGSRGGSGGSPPSNSRFPNTKSGSTTGGYSARGSGPQPRFLGGTVYGGGAKVPYAAGKATPSGVRARGPLSGPALAFWPAGALFLGGAYMYGPYGYHYRYHNETSDEDEDREIICGCAEDSVCMCDEIEDDDFWEELIGDGDYDKLNKTLVDVSEVNGTTTILVNGTLPKGTTVESGDEDDYAEYLTNAANTALQTLGLWPAIGAVAGVVMMV